MAPKRVPSRQLSHLIPSLTSRRELTHSSPAAEIHCSTSDSPALTYSPLEKEQHSRRSSSWLNSCTLTNDSSCSNSFCTRKGGTWFSRSVASKPSNTRSMLAQCGDSPPAASPLPLGRAAPGVPGVPGCCPSAAAAASAAAPLVVRRAPRAPAWRGAWMQAASCGEISFFTLSRSMGKIFCTNASSCCLKSRAGYLASTWRIWGWSVTDR